MLASVSGIVARLTLGLLFQRLFGITEPTSGVLSELLFRQYSFYAVRAARTTHTHSHLISPLSPSPHSPLSLRSSGQAAWHLCS